MVKSSLAFVAVVVALGSSSPAASAATCSGHSNQAAAQHAADTRDGDGDGDGVYCVISPR